MRVRMVIAFLMLSLTEMAAHGGDNQPWKARLLSEGKKSWLEYRDFARRLSGSTQRKIVNDGKVVFQNELQIYQNKDCRRVTSKRVDRGRMTQFTDCQNPHYFFSVARAPGKNAWAMTNLVMDKALIPQMLDTETSGVLRFGMDDLVKLGAHLDLVGLFDYKNLKSIDVNPETLDNQTYAKVVFDCRHPLGDKPFVPFQSGTLLLDPSCHWCIKKAELQVLYGSGEGVEEIVHSYRIHSRGLPIPEQLVKRSKMVNDGKPEAIVTTCEYKLDATPQHDADFYMSAFGLPEPVGIVAPNRPTRWNLWIALGAVVAALIALWLYRRSRRSSATTAT